MSRSFTKLFSSITESTVWCEPLATRIVWITMLAMADHRGRVWASVPGLANRARVTLEEAEAALARFLAPDRYSRTPDHEGRRIEVIDGGWRLLNYAKYRELRDDEDRRQYQRAWDRDNRPLRVRQNPTKPDRARPGPTQAEVEVEAEASKSKTLSGKKPPDASPRRRDAQELLKYLNACTGRSYRLVPANIDLIVARLAEGATADEVGAVIKAKCNEWLGDDKMVAYLRPLTLFNRTKFAQYLGEIPPSAGQAISA